MNSANTGAMTADCDFGWVLSDGDDTVHVCESGEGHEPPHRCGCGLAFDPANPDAWPTNGDADGR